MSFKATVFVAKRGSINEKEEQKDEREDFVAIILVGKWLWRREEIERDRERDEGL